MDAGIGPVLLPAIEVALAVLEGVEAQPFERGGLGMPDPRFDFALSIGIGDPTGESHDAVMLEQISKKRVEGGIVEIGLDNPFPQIVEHDHAGSAAQAAKGPFVQLRPDAGARAEGQQTDGLAAVA